MFFWLTLARANDRMAHFCHQQFASPVCQSLKVHILRNSKKKIENLSINMSKRINFSKMCHIPSVLAADIVYRFGLSRFSSEISFKSAVDNKWFSDASFEISLSFSVENNCARVLRRSGTDVVDTGRDDEDVFFCCDEIEANVDGIGFRIVNLFDVVVEIIGFIGFKEVVTWRRERKCLFWFIITSLC